MKNATLLLGAALLLASIVAAKSDMLRCGNVIVETETYPHLLARLP